MSSQSISVDHHLRELRQLGDELRAARYADQVRRAGHASDEPSFATSLRRIVSGLADRGRPSRANASTVATH